MYETIANKDQSFGYMTVYAMAVLPNGEARVMKYVTGVSLNADMALVRNTALNVLEQQFAKAVHIEVTTKEFYEQFKKEHPDYPERSVVNDRYFIQG